VNGGLVVGAGRFPCLLTSSSFLASSSFSESTSRDPIGSVLCFPILSEVAMFLKSCEREFITKSGGVYSWNFLT